MVLHTTNLGTQMARHTRGIRDADDGGLGENRRIVEVRADPRLNRCISNGERIVITLSKEIQQAIKDSQEDPVRLVDPETNVEYVVLPVETFELMRKGRYYDDGPITEEEQTALLVEMGLSIGWDDPEMDVYNDMVPGRCDES